jgi:hypothetical protein
LTKISDLEERVNRLNEGKEVSLTTEEANTVRGFWIQLNHSPEESQEYSVLRERQDILYENYIAGKWTPEMQEEWTRNGGRMTQIAHDIVMQRAIGNRPLRDRVWPELAPRVLRFYKLTEKPSAELTGDETKELGFLMEWFSELQRKT